MLSLVSSNSEEGCIICVIGYDVIVACMGGLLVWFVGRRSKRLFVDPLLLFASTKKGSGFHGWHMFVGAGRAGFVFRSLLSFTGRRGEVFMDCHVIGALLGKRKLLSVVRRCSTISHSLKFLHCKEPNVLIAINIIIRFGLLVLCLDGKIGRACHSCSVGLVAYLVCLIGIGGVVVRMWLFQSVLRWW